MATAPQIETQHLRLVAFSEKHLAERYVSWLNDPDVVRYSEQRHDTHTLERCREFLKSFDDTPNLYWAIEETATGRHIGNIDAHIDAPNKVADVGIVLGEKEIWGKGYGFEAWTGVLDYLLGPGDMRKVTAGTMATNVGMLGIMRKARMVEEGRRLKNYLLDGKEVDLILVARFADDQD
ncbi:MAG: GNAT family N-acetyltransferase [Rhodospirillaceae bacterium]|nr:GNAT family N-acetyltransferase [Rhodospirillaceae bacterium]